MKDRSLFKIEGVVEEALPGLLFRVRVKSEETGEKEVLAQPAGKMRLHRIRVIPGDRVIIEMPNPEDRRGRIIRRL